MTSEVVVLGAGISGIAAATVLKREGINVTVLEARSRPGGRIHTVSLNHNDHNSNSMFSEHISIFHDKEQCEGQCNSVLVDLGANYLIGCGPAQIDQPLYHIAKMLKCETAVAAGDLCKKYRGWECVELSAWRNHLDPNAPILTEAEIAGTVFLFDKVLYLAIHKHAKYTELEASLDATPLSPFSFAEIFEASIREILEAEAQAGLRKTAAFETVEKGVFESLVARYISYVNPLERLSRTLLDDLNSVHKSADSNGSHSDQASSSSNNNKHHIQVFDGVEPTCANDREMARELATTYPSAEQRQAYLEGIQRKFLSLGIDRERECHSDESTTPDCEEVDEARGNGLAIRRASRPHRTQGVFSRWEDRLVTDSFAGLLKPMLRDLPVQFNTVVRRVTWSDEGVTIAALQTDPQSGQQRERVFHAQHCVCTLPVGVLKGLSVESRVEFQPPLSDRKRQAINNLGIPFAGAASHEKIILRFRAPEDVFWDEDAAHLKCPDVRLHILNLHRYGKPGVLCAHVWGGSGLNVNEQSDEEVVAIVLDLLYRMYPNGAHPRPLATLVTHWSSDPFSLGSYTSGEAGSSEQDRLEYAAPLLTGEGRCPRVLFAGEGTLNSAQAKECTHGALLSGVDRAFDILTHRAQQEQTVTAEDFKKYLNSIRKRLAAYLLGRKSPFFDINAVTGKRSQRRKGESSTGTGQITPQKRKLSLEEERSSCSSSSDSCSTQVMAIPGDQAAISSSNSRHSLVLCESFYLPTIECYGQASPPLPPATAAGHSAKKARHHSGSFSDPIFLGGNG